MAMGWSSDFILAEFKDIQANTMAMDSTGSLLLLPGRKCLALKNLNADIDEIEVIQRLSKCEIGKVSWNPHDHNKELCALCKGTQLEILNFKNKRELSTHSILKSHTRVVTDVDWHPVDPNTLVTSSLDTFTYVWDIRESSKPVIQFSSFAGAMHAKWNKLSRHIMATTHGGDVKIWDERKASSPIQYITAHFTSIHSIDWSPLNENHVCTGSQDGSVKFFDIMNPGKTEHIMNADAPVWRARYTPFGRGMMLIVLPQNRKFETSVLLWNLTSPTIPLHAFVGHTDVVQDFQWRKYKQDFSEYQLITWCKDQTLRIWEIDKYLQQLCDLDAEDLIVDIGDRMIPTTEEISSAALVEADGMHSCNNNIEEGYDVNDAAYMMNSTTQDTMDSQSSPKNLHQEFTNSFNLPYVQMHKMDVVRRSCIVTVRYSKHVISLWVTFPASYPRNKPPVFHFTQATTINMAARIKLLKVLKETAEQRVKSNRTCLEDCMRQLVSTMQQILSTDVDKYSAFSVDRFLSDRSNTPFNINHESYLVCPRTSGVKFCHVGKLVFFARNGTTLNPEPSQCSNTTMSGMTTSQTQALYKLYLQNKNGTLPAHTKFILKRGLLKNLKTNAHRSRRTIIVYDITCLLLIRKELAMRYKFSNGDIASACRHNASVANHFGRKSIAHIWSLASCASSLCTTTGFHWKQNPFAKKMIDFFITTYLVHADIQTAAMLSCIFSYPDNTPSHKNSTQCGASYSLDLSSDSRNVNLPGSVRLPLIEPAVEPTELTFFKDKNHDALKCAYAEILHRWGLINARTSVMKCVNRVIMKDYNYVQLAAECSRCQQLFPGMSCNNCKQPTLSCIICRLPVRGSAISCLSCGHGGHSKHMIQWFTNSAVCAAGCKCRCLKPSLSSALKNFQ